MSGFQNVTTNIRVIWVNPKRITKNNPQATDYLLADCPFLRMHHICTTKPLFDGNGARVAVVVEGVRDLIVGERHFLCRPFGTLLLLFLQGFLRPCGSKATRGRAAPLPGRLVLTIVFLMPFQGFVPAFYSLRNLKIFIISNCWIKFFLILANSFPQTKQVANSFPQTK